MGSPVIGWQTFMEDYMLEYYEERAAIMEHEGELEPDEAEYLAYKETLQKWWGPKPHDN